MVIFPQVAGLGGSPIARFHAIGSLEEARAYLRLPSLRAGLPECVGALLDLTGRSATSVLGDLDAMKLRSSLTLFIGAGLGPLFPRCCSVGLRGKRTERSCNSWGANDDRDSSDPSRTD